ncbi:MAG: hypothetical protein JEZ09_10015 [Salinivirgaceae bacterium]|nr:hypothetical protein [Salinivirgaceae bacterium]
MDKLIELYHKYTANITEFAIGIGVLILFIIVSGLFKKLITHKVKPKTKNPLLAEFLGKIVALTITLIGFIIFLEIIGLGNFAINSVSKFYLIPLC